MSDPIGLNMLAKGDVVCQSEIPSRTAEVVSTLPFKKPIYEILFGTQILHLRASLTKKGRAGKQFVQVSKADGGRWAMEPNAPIWMPLAAYSALADAAAPPATPEAAQESGDTISSVNPYCKCEEKHAPNVTHCEMQ